MGVLLASDGIFIRKKKENMPGQIKICSEKKAGASCDIKLSMTQEEKTRHF